MSGCRVCGKPLRNQKLRLCNPHYLLWRRHRRLRSTRAPAGSGTTSSHGYKKISLNGKQIYEHVRVVEDFIGFNPGYIYHLDGDKKNNNLSNLIAFNNEAEAGLLERQIVAFMATGDKDKRLCGKCGKYDDVANMYVYRSASKKGVRYRHATEHGVCIKTTKEERGKRSARIGPAIKRHVPQDAYY